MLAWLLSFAALAAVVGFLSGVFWWGVVDLPTYTIGEDFRGYTTERALLGERPFRGVAAEVFADRVGREIDDAPPEHAGEETDHHGEPGERQEPGEHRPD